MGVYSVSRTNPFVWKDTVNTKVGFGFSASSTTYHVNTASTTRAAAKTEFKATALGGEASWKPSGVNAQVGVVNLEVKHTNASGTSTSYFKAEALTAKVGLGVLNEAKKSDVKVYGAQASAVVAKTTVGREFKVGSVSINLSGTVGYGASAGVSAGVDKTGFRVKAEAGLGAIFGGDVSVSWDTKSIDKALDTRKVVSGGGASSGSSRENSRQA